MEPPDATSPQTQAVLAQGLDLLERASAAGLTLRLIGSLAVQLTCPQWRSLAITLDRRPSQDVDLVGLSREERRTDRFFAEAGYTLHPAVKHSREFGVRRLVFESTTGGPKVDIFLDDLVMAHTVPLQGRLDIPGPTVNIADLLLSKLQIHEMTRNDQVDLCILLAEHDLTSHGGTLDDGRVTDLLGKDWGFWYSAMTNLEALVAALPGLEGLPTEAAELVRARSASLVSVLQDCPKSTRWRLRARAGSKKRWYDEVQEVT